MLNLNALRRFAKPMAIIVAAVLWVASGCMSPDTNSGTSAAPGTQPTALSMKSGSQLWTESCSRCHNLRPTQYYSDAQWDIIAHHMRLRANLTGDEQRKITAFLQASN